MEIIGKLTKCINDDKKTSWLVDLEIARKCKWYFYLDENELILLQSYCQSTDKFNFGRFEEVTISRLDGESDILIEIECSEGGTSCYVCSNTLLKILNSEYKTKYIM